ncbi:MAG: glycerol-3-phosphate 1-O-acyltransferase PlsY, partial [Acidobacteriaceae bacterium]|nr:glycerol-3-phosphate 1-O-acyltransferase PlsY [Acidobacteriaceae bacterium]
MSLLLLVIAYLIGSIPFGYLLVKWKTGRDVRSMGSGNIGATNVVRTTGWGIGVATLLLDIAKGFVAVFLMARFGELSPFWTSAAALAVIAGHAFPVFLRFRGGKAVASFIGAFLYLTPLPLFATLLVFVVGVAVSKHISLGSVLAAGTFPLAVFLILHPEWPIMIASIITAAFIVYRHRENIQRIRQERESVFTLGRRT